MARRLMYAQLKSGYDIDRRPSWFWLSGPKRDQTDCRYEPTTTIIDPNTQTTYDAFLTGTSPPGRETD